MTGNVKKLTPSETWKRFAEASVVATRLVGPTAETQWQATERLTGLDSDTLYSIAQKVGHQHLRNDDDPAGLFLTGILYGWMLSRLADGDSVPDSPDVGGNELAGEE